MRQFGDRLRSRIKGAGFSSVSSLLRGIRMNHGFITSLRRGDQIDAGIMKIATIAIMLGKRPSELMAEMDDLLLNPEPLTAEAIQVLGVPGRAEDYDPFKLAIVADVVLGWDEEMNEGADQQRIAALIGALYEEMVRPDRTITPLELRRRAMARVFGIDLPESPAARRGRGRPSSADAA